MASDAIVLPTFQLQIFKNSQTAKYSIYYKKECFYIELFANENAVLFPGKVSQTRASYEVDVGITIGIPPPYFGELEPCPNWHKFFEIKLVQEDSWIQLPKGAYKVKLVNTSPNKLARIKKGDPVGRIKLYIPTQFDVVELRRPYGEPVLDLEKRKNSGPTLTDFPKFWIPRSQIKRLNK